MASNILCIQRLPRGLLDWTKEHRSLNDGVFRGHFSNDFLGLFVVCLTMSLFALVLIAVSFLILAGEHL